MKCHCVDHKQNNNAEMCLTSQGLGIIIPYFLDFNDLENRSGEMNKDILWEMQSVFTGNGEMS